MYTSITFAIDHKLKSKFNELVKDSPITRNELGSAMLEYCINHLDDNLLVELVSIANQAKIDSITNKPKSGITVSSVTDS